MAVNKRAVGADKEQLAARYLVDNGYTVLERNFRNKTGEKILSQRKIIILYLLRLNTEVITNTDMQLKL